MLSPDEKNSDSAGMADDPSGGKMLLPHPWTPLESPHDAEAWIWRLDQALQQKVDPRRASGQGACLWLAHGGLIWLHTAQDGIILDVSPEAAWAAPVISAATGVADPGRQVWRLPDDTLIQLLMGLNSLIEATSLVLQHRYK